MGNIEGIPNKDLCSCQFEEHIVEDKTVFIEEKTPGKFVQQRTGENDYSGVDVDDFEAGEISPNVTVYETTLRNYRSLINTFTIENRFSRTTRGFYESQTNIVTNSFNSFSSTSNDLTNSKSWQTETIAKTQITSTTCTCPPNSLDSWWIHREISSITSVIVSSIIILANLFVMGSVLWSLWQRHKHRTIIPLNRSYIFIFNLALADLLVGIANVINFSKNRIETTSSTSYETCLLEICFIITPCCASIFTMTVIGIDRYLTVMQPFKYKSLITVKKAVIIVIIVWIISCLIGFAPLMGWGKQSEVYYSKGQICSYLFVVESSFVIFTLFGGFLPQLVVIIYLYSEIFKVSRKHSVQISNLQQPSKMTRERGNSYGTFPKEVFVAPTYSRSCPVTPIMPRIEIKHENEHLAKTQLPVRRKPFRTVSFGPASFENDFSRSLSASSNDSSNFECHRLTRSKMKDNQLDDNVFENSLSLPGTVFSQKRLPEISTTKEEIISIPVLQKETKNNTKKVKRTVSYAGSVALTSLASQISNRFGNLKKEVAKRNVKALRTVATVIGFFFFMWTPFLLLSVIQVICGSSCHLQNLVGTYLLLLGITNSAINPLVYTYTNRELKHHILRICCKKRRRNIITNHEPMQSETFPNSSMGYSVDGSQASQAWINHRRHTRGSLASSVNETAKSRLGRTSIDSRRFSGSRVRSTGLKTAPSRRSNSIHIVKSEIPKNQNHLLVPPSERKQSIVKFDRGASNTLKVSTSFIN